MERLVFRKDVRDLSDAEKILVDYPLTAKEEEFLVPVVDRLLTEGKEIPESSEELFALVRKTVTVTPHDDGTVTYWSVYKQSWRRVSRVPDKDFAALPRDEQAIIDKHMAANKKTVL